MLPRCHSMMTGQSDALLAAGDLDGAVTWRKIIKAIEVMQATEPDGTAH